MTTPSPSPYSSSRTSTEQSRVGTTDSCVSISLFDSWTGRKILETIGFEPNASVSSEELHVCM